jgi:hypothetical protein
VRAILLPHIGREVSCVDSCVIPIAREEVSYVHSVCFNQVSRGCSQRSADYWERLTESLETPLKTSCRNARGNLD